MYNLKTFSDPFISFAIALIFTTLSWPRIFVMVFTALSRGLVARKTAFNKLRSTSILNSVSKAKVSDRGLGFPLQRTKQKSRHRKIGLISLEISLLFDGFPTNGKESFTSSQYIKYLKTQETLVLPFLALK